MQRDSPKFQKVHYLHIFIDTPLWNDLSFYGIWDVCFFKNICPFCLCHLWNVAINRRICVSHTHILVFTITSQKYLSLDEYNWVWNLHGRTTMVWPCRALGFTRSGFCGIYSPSPSSWRSSVCFRNYVF